MVWEKESFIRYKLWFSLIRYVVARPSTTEWENWRDIATAVSFRLMLSKFYSSPTFRQSHRLRVLVRSLKFSRVYSCSCSFVWSFTPICVEVSSSLGWRTETLFWPGAGSPENFDIFFAKRDVCFVADFFTDWKESECSITKFGISSTYFESVYGFCFSCSLSSLGRMYVWVSSYNKTSFLTLDESNWLNSESFFFVVSRS